MILVNSVKIFYTIIHFSYAVYNTSIDPIDNLASLANEQ